MGPDAASNTATTSNMANQSSGPDDKFLFDCEHLIMFCSYFEKLDVHDQTEYDRSQNERSGQQMEENAKLLRNFDVSSRINKSKGN